MARMRRPNENVEEQNSGGGSFGGGGDIKGPDTGDNGGIFQLPPPLDPDQRSGETPRERPQPLPIPPPSGGAGPYDDGAHNQMAQPGGGQSQAALRRPSAPSIGAGSVVQSGGGAPSSGLMPFTPMRSDFGAADMAGKTSNLFGSMGGLKGGGLGVPMDQTPNEQSDPISSLIQQLLQQGGSRKPF